MKSEGDKKPHLKVFNFENAVFLKNKILWFNPFGPFDPLFILLLLNSSILKTLRVNGIPSPTFFKWIFDKFPNDTQVDRLWILVF